MTESFDLPMADAVDIAILMHRDAHFGGKFDLMIDYYLKDGRGVMQEFEIDRIKELALLEKHSSQNLAATLLSGSDAEKVADALEAYRKLRELYEKENSATLKYPRLIADLILAENEEIDSAIKAIVAEKAAIVPALITLLRAEEYQDPLFPGYGQAPALASQCLAQLGDKRAIIALFESLGENDFVSEDVSLDALEKIGTPAKEFLLKVLHGKPINFDNERAAMALIRFKDDPEVTAAAFNMLQELNLKRDTILATDLILICEGLKDPASRKRFIEIAASDETPASLRKDMQTISRSWNSL